MPGTGRKTGLIHAPPGNALKTALRAATFFLTSHDIARLQPFGAGNINDTFLVTLHSGGRRILQRLNPAVFPEPVRVMDNVRLVTEHLRQERDRNGIAPEQFRIASLVAGRTGDFYRAADGSIWRLMTFIADSRTYQTIRRGKQAEELGRTLGIFHRLTGTLDPGRLAETLPGFHQTASYLQQYDRISAAQDGRAGPEIACCRAAVDQRRALVTILEEVRGRLHQQVIHADPKVTNFLFDRHADRVVSLIDLDTVRPGLLLHDIGDALRSCCNPGGETGRSGQTIFAPELFRSWLRGYYQEAGFLLTDEDRTRIIAAVLLMTFELGLRFFTDHLSGNRYFKTSFQGHNLQRALVQFDLATSIEQQTGTLESIINDTAATGPSR